MAQTVSPSDFPDSIELLTHCGGKCVYELGLFAKYWESGKVKTRLAAKTGELAACRIYQVFLRHLIGLTASVDVLDRQAIVFSPIESESDFETLLRSDTSVGEAQFRLVPQQQVPDLGQRMKGFFEHAFSETKPAAEKVVVIGSDTPDLSLDVFTEVHQLLDHYPVVLGPSTDGGYYLIAIRNEPADLESIFAIFAEMPWSTSDVLPRTIEKLKQSGIGYSLLAPMTDIDHHADLLDLVSRLTRSTDSHHQRLASELERLNRDAECGGFLDDQ